MFRVGSFCGAGTLIDDDAAGDFSKCGGMTNVSTMELDEFEGDSIMKSHLLVTVGDQGNTREIGAFRA